MRHWDEVMQMKHRRWLGWAILVAGVIVLDGGRVLQGAALPFSSAMPIFAAGMSNSHGPTGYLGVETRDISQDEIIPLKLKDLRGVEIIALDHDGPACKAGIRVHDVVLQIDGQVLEGEEQLRKRLKDMQAGRTITFLISRDGQTQSFTMQMADRRTVGLEAWGQHYSVPAPDPTSYSARGGNTFLDSAPSSTAAISSPKGHRDILAMNMIMSSSFTGAKLEVMGAQLAQYFGAEGGAGLLVRSVDGNSPAELAGMKAGDVVVEINSISVTSGAEWTKTVHDNKGRPVPVIVLRDKHQLTLILTPDGKKRSSLNTGYDFEHFFGETSQQTAELIATL
jgi:serine protease Do